MARPPWHRWYSTKEWQALREQALKRDNYTCQRTGTVCTGIYPAWNSPTVNHKVPHRGNRDLFFNLDNLETVTKEIHDTVIQREEQASLGTRGVWY